MDWQGQPRETSCEKGWEGKQCGCTKAYRRQELGRRRAGWPPQSAPQPPKAPIYTFVMISKWAYVDNHRDTPIGLKEGLSSTSLNWSLTWPLARVYHLFIKGTAKTLELLLCAKHCPRYRSYSGEQNRGQESLALWSLSYAHNFFGLEMILWTIQLHALPFVSSSVNLWNVNPMTLSQSCLAFLHF